MEEMIDLWDTLISDVHKDAYGFRPRHYPRFMKKSEYEAEMDRLEKAVEESIKQDEIRYREAREAFEKRIAETINAGAKDRKTAIRWMFDGSGEDWFEHWIWLEGLNVMTDTYNYMNEMEGKIIS